MSDETNGTVHRTYRATAAERQRYVVVVGLAVAAGLVWLLIERTSVGLTVGTLVVVVGGAALFYRSTGRGSTVATDAALLVSSASRPEPYRWSEIVHIDAMTNPNTGDPARLVAILFRRDPQGRLDARILPYVNDRQLGGEGALTVEVGFLRELWFAGGGVDGAAEIGPEITESWRRLQSQNATTMRRARLLGFAVPVVLLVVVVLVVALTR